MKPSGTTTASVALGEPCVTGLPQVSKVGGFNRLLILEFSFLALRARTCQRVCVGHLPTGMLDGLTGNSTAEEEGGGREGQTGTNPQQTQGE